MGSTILESLVIISMVLEVRVPIGAILARPTQNEALGSTILDAWTQKFNLAADLDQQMSPSSNKEGGAHEFSCVQVPSASEHAEDGKSMLWISKH